jgi:hypothetical protein
LKAQQVLYESTVAEVIRLNADYSALKQQYLELENNTRLNDNIVDLVNSELFELSAAGEMLSATLGSAGLGDLTHVVDSPTAAAAGAGSLGVSESPQKVLAPSAPVA